MQFTLKAEASHESAAQLPRGERQDKKKPARKTNRASTGRQPYIDTNTQHAAETFARSAIAKFFGQSSRNRRTQGLPAPPPGEHCPGALSHGLLSCGCARSGTARRFATIRWLFIGISRQCASGSGHAWSAVQTTAKNKFCARASPLRGGHGAPKQSADFVGTTDCPTQAQTLLHGLASWSDNVEMTLGI